MAVLIATFERPDELARLLRALEVEVSRLAGDAEVVVADNDPSASARQVVTDLSETVSYRLRYVLQPVPGIAHTRNALLDEAASADLLVFIDDDEVPRPGWLESLAAAVEDLDADVVTGPVEFEFATPVSALVAQSPCFQVPERPTGAIDPWPKTGNVLIRRTVLDRTGLRFPEEYSLSGGSDSALFARLAHLGSPPRWCAEAIVVEHVPAQRSTLRYVLRRGLRVGNTIAWVERDSGDRRIVLIRTLKVAAAALRGLVVAISGAALRRPDRLSFGLYEVYRAVGMALGLLGRRVVEYQRVKSPDSSSAV